jgi:hypothetical protein
MSFSATKEGSRLLTFKEVIIDTGLTEILCNFNWYLKNAFSDEILRLILLEVYLCSLSKANHVLIIDVLISDSSDILYSSNTKSKKAERSF